jgi:hypothetical protein
MHSTSLFSESQEIFNHSLAGGKFPVKKFGVELDSKKGSVYVLHCLNFAGFIRGGAYEVSRQLLDLVAVRMPDGYPTGKILKEARTGGLDFVVAALSFRSLVAFTGLQTLH